MLETIASPPVLRSKVSVPAFNYVFNIILPTIKWSNTASTHIVDVSSVRGLSRRALQYKFKPDDKIPQHRRIGKKQSVAVRLISNWTSLFSVLICKVCQVRESFCETTFLQNGRTSNDVIGASCCQPVIENAFYQPLAKIATGIKSKGVRTSVNCHYRYILGGGKRRFFLFGIWVVIIIGIVMGRWS